MIKENLSKFTYVVGDRKINFHQPKVMGILNVTPDSFYDGDRYNSKTNIEKKIAQLISEGVDIIDIGAVSSRPGTNEICEKEELRRLVIPLTIIRKSYPNMIISIDTFRTTVVDFVHRCFGSIIVNDIYGGRFDERMPQTIAKYDLPYILMHMKGTPQIMQKRPRYKNIISEINTFFKDRISKFIQHGAKQLLLDPGFGFGKTISHNYVLLANLNTFNNYGFPVVVGISRKSMIFKLLNIDVEDALYGTVALNILALQNGAKILRVHDVKEAKQIIKLFNTYQKSLLYK